MMKKRSNVFDQSSDSESDGDTNILKRPTKVLKLHGEQNLSSDLGDSGDVDYMSINIESKDKFPPTDDDDYKYQETNGLEHSLFKVDEVEKSIGQKMMEKMGFKEGNSLGTKSTGRTLDPIIVEKRNSKEGIGAPKPIPVVIKLESIQDYRKYMNDLNQANSDRKEVNDAMKICFNFDPLSEQYYNNSSFFCFEKLDFRWRKYALDNYLKRECILEEHRITQIKGNSNSVPYIMSRWKTIMSDEFCKFLTLDAQEQLMILLDWLRSQKAYCFYCGAQYNDNEDLNDNCPGITKQSHNIF